MTAGDLEDYYTSLKRRLSTNSVIKQHAIIHSTLKWAYKHDWLNRNVADMVDTMRKEKPELDEPYSVEEIAELLKVVRNHPIYLPVLMAAMFGLRRSEVLGLKWSAIDFEKKEFTVRTTVVRQHCGKRLKTTVRENVTKSASSKRVLPLSDYAVRLLREAKREQERNRALCGNCYNTQYLDFLCVNQMGDLLNPDYISQSFQKLLKRNGLRHIRFHDLRHSCASILADMGYSMKNIQTWLGHSDYNFTANTYVHTERGAHAEMAKEFSENLMEYSGM